VLGEKLEKKKVVVFQYPNGWWQAFKLQFFPVWLLKRFPVKYKVERIIVSFEEYALYPKFPKVLPPQEYGAVVVYKDFIKEL
jgi:hypothetical protein